MVYMVLQGMHPYGEGFTLVSPFTYTDCVYHYARQYTTSSLLVIR